MDIFFSLPFPAGTANIPKNVMKNDDFSRSPILISFNDQIFFSKTAGVQEERLIMPHLKLTAIGDVEWESRKQNVQTNGSRIMSAKDSW
jgi:hypothetical protein